MAGTFTFVPSKNISKSTKTRTREISFGDGYSQRVPDGINNILREWKLTFENRGIDTANQIISFLESQNGSESFSWTPPGTNTSYRVVCMEWSETDTSHISKTISATFKQVFD
jgi:phage-related protein